MAKSKRCLAGTLIAAIFSSTSFAADMNLLQAWQMASGYDATFRAERAALDASRENVPQAIAQLLPSVAISGSTEKNNTKLDYQNVYGNDANRDYEFNSKTYRLSVSQPIFRYRNIAQYQQAKAQERYGNARFMGAENQLFIRVSQSYFDLLLAEDNLELIRAQKTSLQQQLQQAQNMFKGGVGTITDVHEAQARLDIIVSQEAQASNQLEIRRRQLEEITGKKPVKLAKLTDNMPLSNPEPNTYEHWLQLALEKNSDILSKKANRDHARQELAKSISDHLPTVDAVASWTFEKNPGYSSINTQNRNAVVGLQVSLPLFQGGGTLSRNRQTEALYRQAQEELDAITRKISTQTSDHYLSVQKGVVEVKALQQAVFSSESALHSTQMGFKAGTRTTLDILNAQQQVFQSKRDLSRAKYEYVLNQLLLKADAGVLGEADVVMVNTWLEK